MKTQELKNLIGSKIKERRKQLKLSQEELANALGINQSMISNYETGRFMPEFPMQVKIFDYLGINFSELIKDKI